MMLGQLLAELQDGAGIGIHILAQQAFLVAQQRRLENASKLRLGERAPIAKVQLVQIVPDADDFGAAVPDRSEDIMEFVEILVPEQMEIPRRLSTRDVFGGVVHVPRPMTQKFIENVKR